MVNIIVWAVVITIIAVLFIIIRFRHMRHRFYVIAIVLILAFFYLSGMNIIKQNDVDLTSFNGFVTAGKIYVKWMGKVVENVKSVSGNVIKMDWSG